MNLSDDLSQVGMEELSDEDQEQLVAILDQYMIAFEEGQSPDIEQLVKEHPHLEDPIRQYLAPLDLINQATEQHAVVGIPGSQSSVQLTDYHVGEEIGQGAMGIVYSAVHKESGETVALKVLSSGAIVNSQVVKRFAREARVAGSLRHDNIVPVFDVGCEVGVHFYTMQKIEGGSLDDLIQAARVRRRRNKESDSILFCPARYHELALRFAEIADALELAHQSEVIHRDIKPSNLLLDKSEKLWVTDFGLVRDANDCGLTETGDVIGTYRYMSPEQARGENDKIGPQSDVYSLGATLFEVLTLRPVFRGNDVARLLMKMEQNVPQSPRHWNSDIPYDLETIVLKALQPDLSNRYASASELAEDLRRFANGARIRARRKNAIQTLSTWVSNHQKFLVPAACMIFMFVAWWANENRHDGSAAVTEPNAPSLVREIAEARIDELLRSPQVDSKLSDSVQRTLVLLERHQGRHDQMYLYSHLLNQWSSVIWESGDVSSPRELVRKAAQVNDALPASPRTRLLKTLTGANALIFDVDGLVEGPALGVAQLVKAFPYEELSGDSIDMMQSVLKPLNQVSRILLLEGNLELAETFGDAALRVSQRLSALETFVSKAQEADILGNLGEIRFRLGKLRPSVIALESAARLLDERVADVGYRKDTRLAICSVADLLALAYGKLHENDKAEDVYARAVELVDGFSVDSDDVGLCVRMASLCNNAGRFYKSTLAADTANELFARAFAFQKRAVMLSPKNVGLRNDLRTIEQNLRMVSMKPSAVES